MADRERVIDMHDDWTTKETADFLHLTVQRVGQLARDGTLRAEKRGRDWFVDPQSAIEYRDTPHPVGRPETTGARRRRAERRARRQAGS
jgi:hypothetical protein